MAAPVNPGRLARLGNWFTSWSPTNYLKSYKVDNELYLRELSGSDDFTNLIKELSRHAPSISEKINSSILNWGIGENKAEFQEGLFVHTAAIICKNYLQNRKNVPLPEIIHVVVTGLSQSTINNISKKSNFYQLACDILQQYPVIGNFSFIVQPFADLLSELHEATQVSTDYDKDSKLVATIALLNDKFVAYARNEILTFPPELVNEAYRPFLQVIAPIVADNGVFVPFWNNIKARVPSLVSVVLTHLKTLLAENNEDELPAKLKQDFKALYTASRPGEEKTFARTILNRYFKPILESKLIPNTFRDILINKLVDLASAKLVENKNAIEAFLEDRPAPVQPQQPVPVLPPAPDGAPVEPIAPPRAQAWYDRYLPETFASAYKNADTAYLATLNPELTDLVNSLSLKLPNLTESAPAAVKAMMGENAKAIHQGVFVHFIASLCKTIYKDAAGPFPLDKITTDISLHLAQILTTTLHPNPPVTEKSFYEPAKTILMGICPEIGEIPYVIDPFAKLLYEVYLSKELPDAYDKEDKLVQTVAQFTSKILNFSKKEIKGLPKHFIKEPFKTIAKQALPLMVDNPMFKGVWDFVEARIPALTQMVLNHLRALLIPDALAPEIDKDEELVRRLKADFKEQWQRVPNNFPLLSENLIDRYLAPVFNSPFIPATFRAMAKRKLVEVLAAKLSENIVKIEAALFDKPVPPALPVIFVSAPVLPVDAANPPIMEPGFLDRYTPQGIAKSYREENEQYLRDLIDGDGVIRLVKNLSHKVPNLSDYAPDYVKAMINGSANELHEGIFVHLVTSLCKTIYKDRKPFSELEVALNIADYLSRSIKETFDKADFNRELKPEDFREAADKLIKSTLPELGDIPYAIDPVSKLLYEFYLFSRVTPTEPQKDPLLDTVANYNNKALEVVAKQAADLKNSEELASIDKSLGEILNLFINNNKNNPIFVKIWGFVEKQIPSLLQTEITYLRGLFNARTNRELFIKLALDFNSIWKANRNDFDALAKAILERYFAPILNSNLIPASFRPFIVPLITEKLKDYLIKNQANIDAALRAFELEKELLINDPLKPFQEEARQVVQALTKRFYPNLAKHLPKEITEELGKSIMEESLYHVFGRLQIKFKARSYKELQSNLLGFVHQKLNVLVKGAEIEESIYGRIAQELLDEVAPGVNAYTLVAKGQLTDYLRTLVEIVRYREPRELGFGELDKEMKPFLYSIVDFILEKSLDKPRDIIDEVVLDPADLKHPETLKLARETLYKHLANGFANFFGNGKLHQGLHALLGTFSQYGKDKERITAYFNEWVARFEFPKKAASISDEATTQVVEALLNKIERSKRSYLNDLLNQFASIKEGDKEKTEAEIKERKGQLCRHIILNLNLDRALKDLEPILLQMEKLDKEMGTTLMTALLPSLSREKYPDLFDNLTDMFPASLLRMMGQIPERLNKFGATDLESLTHPQIHPGATILSKLSTLTDAISESANDSGMVIGKQLAAFFVEVGASHIIVNNKNDIDLLIATLAQHNFITFNDEELKDYAHDLIKTLCPVLQAFSPSSEEMVIKLLNIAKSKIPSNDRKGYRKQIKQILVDPNDRSDHHKDDVRRYISQIDDAVFAFAGLILKWTRAYGAENLPESLRQIVKVDGPLLKHSQEVIAALILKGILNFLRKVEETNPGPKSTLLGRSLYLIINTIVKNLPDIKEGNFKELGAALWNLFEIDKDLNIDLSFVKNELLPKKLMEYSGSIRKHIDQIDSNTKELADLFGKHNLPEACRVLGIWLRDFIPHYVKENSGDISKILLGEINAFFETSVLRESDASFIQSSIQELIKDREGNAMKDVYSFAGLYAFAFMLKTFSNVFKKKKIDGLAQVIARSAIKKGSAYYTKVADIKGARSYAHLLGPDELKDGLKELFSDGMPIRNDEELSNTQKAFYGRLSEKIEAAADIDDPEELPMVDFLQGSFHNILTNKLLPSVLTSIVKTVGSRKTINNGLLAFIKTATKNVNSDWDQLEDKYLDVLCQLDDLNYRLTDNKYVGKIKNLVIKAKTEYGADSKKVMDILEFVKTNTDKFKPTDDATLKKLKNDTKDLLQPLIDLANNQDEDLDADLSNLRDAIIRLVPKRFVADLLQIEAFNEMTRNQLGILYNQLMHNVKFEDWVNDGSEMLMKALYPTGELHNNHFGMSDGGELKTNLKDEPYSVEEAKRDEKNIIDGFADVSVNGTNKAILHKIKIYIRELSMKIGQLLIKWFGVRVIPLRKGYTAFTDLIAKLLEPLFYAISYIFAPVIKFVERKVARREFADHIKGFHADYNQNIILLLLEDLIATLTKNDEKDLQDSHAGV